MVQDNFGKGSDSVVNSLLCKAPISVAISAYSFHSHRRPESLHMQLYVTYTGRKPRLSLCVEPTQTRFFWGEGDLACSGCSLMTAIGSASHFSHLVEQSLLYILGCASWL